MFGYQKPQSICMLLLPVRLPWDMASAGFEVSVGFRREVHESSTVPTYAPRSSYTTPGNFHRCRIFLLFSPIAWYP
ncbi:hypothetical protein LZ30DRAFT_336684 [Colletotrichum cereale]|nr:hypothetical protein LZ30DRAFT_336684 [Colletotrichum cereale]